MASPTPANEPAHAAPPQPPFSPQIILQQPGGTFGRMGKVLLALLILSVLINIGQWNRYRSYFTTGEEIQEKYHSLSEHATDKVAVIRIEGLISSEDGFVKRQIDQVRRDKNVKAVVLRINSPGGTVAASSYLYHHLKELATDKERPLPLVVSMGGLCASGGYYVAMAVGDQQDAIYAEPSTWTGSIGVIVPHFDLSQLMESWKIKDDSVMSHPYKEMLSPTESLAEDVNPEQRKIVQALVDGSFETFKDVVRAGRPALRQNDAELDLVATGQLFSADQALKHRLVDKLGYIEDAIDRAITLAGLDKENVRAVQYMQPPGLFDMVSHAASSGSDRASLERLLDLAAPRAYYLCTWLPAVLSTAR